MERYRIVHDVSYGKWFIMSGTDARPKVVYQGPSQDAVEEFLNDFDYEAITEEEFEIKYRLAYQSEIGDYKRRTSEEQDARRAYIAECHAAEEQRKQEEAKIEAKRATYGPW